MLLAANTATLMALQTTYNADFASFANSSVAFFVGTEQSVISIQLIRSVGSEWSVKRPDAAQLDQRWRWLPSSAATVTARPLPD